MADDPGAAPYHAHVYYAPDERPAAATLRDRFRDAGPEDPLSAILFVGELRDQKAELGGFFNAEIAEKVRRSQRCRALRDLCAPLRAPR